VVDGRCDRAPGELREITEVCDALPSLGPDWCALVEFAASYYQRSVGEIALACCRPSCAGSAATRSPTASGACTAPTRRPARRPRRRPTRNPR
jgi:primosomal protein N' (replication factor Y)